MSLLNFAGSCNCYLIGGFANETTGQKYCNSLGAVLAVPETLSEVATLSTYVARHFDDGDLRTTWLGYMKIGGVFVNILTGQEIPGGLWAEGQPDNKAGNQSCTKTYFKWEQPSVDDTNCSYNRLVLCQKSCCTN